MSVNSENHETKGFTLIELLVVIAIVAILAAILFPVFMSAKKAGQAKACFANTRSLGLASVLYADDNGGSLVPAVAREYYSNQATGFKERRYWRKLLFPYVKSTGAYICPAMPNEAAAWGPVPEQDIPGTYGINQGVTSNDSDWQGHWVHRAGEYRCPTRIILLTEVRNGVWTTGAHLLLAVNLVGNPNDRRPQHPYTPRWHNDKWNVAFLDGHARTMYAYDTIGDTPSEWMWHDPHVNPKYGDVAAIAATQKFLKDQWPKNYPPFGQ